MWPAEGSRGHMHKTRTEACSRVAGARAPLSLFCAQSGARRAGGGAYGPTAFFLRQQQHQMQRATQHAICGAG